MANPFLVVSHATKRYGAVTALDGVDLSLERGRSLALLGPSGCGKTTLLRSIAGLETLDGGRIEVDGQVLTGERTFVRPEQRRVGMVFQDWALFPHMSVAKNVAYGLSRREVAAGRVADALDMVDMRHLADRKPHELSGGQGQRVALARALAPRPSLLLFDEPFSSLDSELRLSVRTEVAALLREVGVTSVFVTHDQEEAFVLGDEVAVMKDGSIEQVGRPTDVYDAPSSPWVAGFVGEANLIPAALDGATAQTRLGAVPLAQPGSGQADVLLRPEYLSVAAGDSACIDGIEFYGHDTSYRVSTPDANLLVRVLAAPKFAVGDRVSLRYVGPPTVAFAPRAGGARRTASLPDDIPAVSSADRRPVAV